MLLIKSNKIRIDWHKKVIQELNRCQEIRFHLPSKQKHRIQNKTKISSKNVFSK